MRIGINQRIAKGTDMHAGANVSPSGCITCVKWLFMIAFWPFILIYFYVKWCLSNDKKNKNKPFWKRTWVIVTVLILVFWMFAGLAWASLGSPTDNGTISDSISDQQSLESNNFAEIKSSDPKDFISAKSPIERPSSSAESDSKQEEISNVFVPEPSHSATGEPNVSPSSQLSEEQGESMNQGLLEQEAAQQEPQEEFSTPAENINDYVGNLNSKKFHYSWCDSVLRMSEGNKYYFSGTRDEMIQKGYKPCQNCNP